jgi:iron complex outermembrane receptor protein
VLNNASIADDDINPLTYKGLRVGLRYDINDDWNLLVTQSFQDMNANGVFYQLPFASDCPTPTDHTTCTLNANGLVYQGAPLKPLEVTLFNVGETNDKFSNTALTVSGRMGPISLVYAGAYLTRDSFQIQDYTNYARGVWGSYYQCTGYSGASVNKCYTPSSVWHDTTRNVNQSHELRFSTPTDWKVTAIAGAFWEKRNLNDQTDWLYKSVPECSTGGPGSCFLWLDPSAAPKFDDASVNNPDRRRPTTGFFDDFRRTYKQTAFFASVDWHIIDSLTLTAGTRYYDISNEMLGANVGSFFCKVYGTGETGPCTGALYGYGDAVAPYGTNLDNQDPHSSKSTGFKSRVNLSWKFSDSGLVYATWSQGYRPGGFNRGEAQQLPSVVRNAAGVPTGPGPNQWHVPAAYESDDLVNKEIGWKTTFLDNRLQFNGAIYQEDWSSVQTGIFAPQLGLGNLTVGLNGPTRSRARPHTTKAS